MGCVADWPAAEDNTAFDLALAAEFHRVERVRTSALAGRVLGVACISEPARTHEW